MGNPYKKPRWILKIALLTGVGGILAGYDMGIITGALLFIQNSISMTDAETGFIVGAVLVGALIGTLIAGPMVDHWGRKVTISFSSLIIIVGILSILLSHSFMTLLMSRWVLGAGVGIIAVSIPLYTAELMPKYIRGKYVTLFQLFLTMGIGAAYLVDLIFIPSENWKAMFAVELLPASILYFGIRGLPESPYWLVAQNRMHQARYILARTRFDENIQETFQSLIKSVKVKNNHWRDLLSSRLALPLFIGLSIAVLNQGTGITVFLQYAPDILKRAGFGSNFVSTIGSLGIAFVNCIFTLSAVFLVDRVGRRYLLLLGTSGIFISEVFLGLVNQFNLTPQMQGCLSLVGLFFFVVFFAIGPGVVVWLAVSELLPTRVRGKGMSLCLFFNALSGSLFSTLFPSIRNFLGMSGMYWICALFSFCYMLIALFLLPETKAQSLEAIQEYFENRKKSPIDSVVKEE